MDEAVPREVVECPPRQATRKRAGTAVGGDPAACRSWHATKRVRSGRYGSAFSSKSPTADPAHASAVGSATTWERSITGTPTRASGGMVVRAISSGPDRWTEKLRHLQAQDPPHGPEQPVLTNRATARVSQS